MSSTEMAIERLSGRISTLNNLYSRGIVSGPLLRKQLKSILSSGDARTVFDSEIESDKKALKILNRIENPDVWRKLFTKSLQQREDSFYEAVEDILNQDGDRGKQLIRMLELACLPFYSGFLPLGAEKKPAVSEVKPSRVSVLD